MFKILILDILSWADVAANDRWKGDLVAQKYAIVNSSLNKDNTLIRTFLYIFYIYRPPLSSEPRLMAQLSFCVCKKNNENARRLSKPNWRENWKQKWLFWCTCAIVPFGYSGIPMCVYVGLWQVRWWFRAHFLTKQGYFKVTLIWKRSFWCDGCPFCKTQSHSYLSKNCILPFHIIEQLYLTFHLIN